jgi:cardiolipin synthase
MNLSVLPNAICVLRMILVVPIAWALVHDRPQLTLVLFVVAAVSDGLDGFLAKRFGWTSELGKLLDPLADKLLLMTVFIVLALVDLAPQWLAAAVVARDVVIGLGAWAYHHWFGPIGGQPTLVSKLNTALQLLFVLAVVARAATIGVPGAAVLTLGALTFVTTVVSGCDYVLIYSRKAVEASRRGAAA